jgi:hypothetical protein
MTSNTPRRAAGSQVAAGSQPHLPATPRDSGGTRRSVRGWLALAGERGLGMRLAAAAPGIGMLAPAAASGRGTAQALAAAGLVLVAASLAGPLRGWWGTGGLAAVTAVFACAAGRLGVPALAAAGLLVLGYLLLLDAPRNPQPRVLPRWLRRQVPPAACGAIATVAALLLLTVPVPASAWLVVAGAAAAVAAAALALPRQPR